MKTSPLQFTSLSIKLSSTVPQLIYRIKRCPPPTRQSVRNVGHILLAAQNQKSGQMAAIEFFFFVTQNVSLDIKDADNNQCTFLYLQQ